jgi:hypothetical protein
MVELRLDQASNDISPDLNASQAGGRMPSGKNLVLENLLNPASIRNAEPAAAMRRFSVADAGDATRNSSTGKTVRTYSPGHRNRARQADRGSGAAV